MPSTDGSPQQAKADFPQIKLISHLYRQGASPTKHLATTIASGDIFVFLDGHTNPTPESLSRLVEDVELLAGRAIVVPAIAQLDTDRWKNSKRQIGYGYELDLATLRTHWLPLLQMHQREQGGRAFWKSPALIGCGFAMHRNLYAELGGMDPDMYQWGVEDLDLGMKAWLLGYEVLIDPAVTIGHRFRRTFDNYTVDRAAVLANEFRFAMKHLSHPVWEQWIAARQQTISPIFWQQAWQQLEQHKASAEAERDSLQARRIHDEFWFAEHFGLQWPAQDNLTELPTMLGQMAFFSENGSFDPSPEPTQCPSPGPGDAEIAIYINYNGDIIQITDSHLEQITNEGEAIYNYEVPFIVTASLSNDLCGNYTLIVESNRGNENTVEGIISISPGQIVSFPVHFTEGGHGNAKVKAKIVYVNSNVQLAQAEKEESFAEKLLNMEPVRDKLLSYITKDSVNDWTESIVKSGVSSILNGVFTDEQRNLYALEHNLSRSEVDANINNFRDEISGALDGYREEAVDELFGVIKPVYRIRVGESHPLKEDLMNYFDESKFVTHAKNGIESLFDPVEPIITQVPKFIDIELHSLLTIFDELPPSIMSGNFSSFDFDEVKNMRITKGIYIKIPYKVDVLDGIGDGDFKVGVTNPTFDGGFDGWKMGGSMSYSREDEIFEFKLNLRFDHKIGIGSEDETDVRTYIEVIRK